jgi:hypothetical protein
MDVQTAARVFHDWAVGEGLMDEPSAEVISSATELASISNVTDKGTEILRQKRVRAVGFNDALETVTVFTKRVAPISKKQKAALPDKVGDRLISYRQGVSQSINDGPPGTLGGPVYAMRVQGTSSRYTCGSSISVGNNRDAGTLGCLVRNNLGDIFGLTNNHVSGGCSYAPVGLPIVAPGIFDVAPGVLSPFTLGFHQRAMPLVAGSPGNVNPKTNLDAAIFKLHDPNGVTSFQRDVYDTPSIVAPMKAGMTVEKVGRTTALTAGVVSSQIYGAQQIPYQAQLYGFSGGVSFDPVFAISGNTTLFSDAGDSGSLVTTLDGAGNRKAVGIVFGFLNDAKAQGGKLTLVLPLAPILAGLGVTLVSGHNV